MSAACRTAVRGNPQWPVITEQTHRANVDDDGMALRMVLPFQVNYNPR